MNKVPQADYFDKVIDVLITVHWPAFQKAVELHRIVTQESDPADL